MARSGLRSSPRPSAPEPAIQYLMAQVEVSLRGRESAVLFVELNRLPSGRWSLLLSLDTNDLVLNEMTMVQLCNRLRLWNFRTKFASDSEMDRTIAMMLSVAQS